VFLCRSWKASAPPHSLEIFHGKAEFKPSPPWAFISWDEGKEVSHLRYDSWDAGFKSRRCKSIISVMEIFCTNPPTQRTTSVPGTFSCYWTMTWSAQQWNLPRTREVAGTWEVCINSRSSYILLPVSLLSGMTVQSVSSIKVGVMIRFIKNSSNDCPGIDPHSDLIRQLSKGGMNWPWTQEGWDNIPVTKALKGSSIAALSFSNCQTPSRHVFYQDPELHVRDHYMDPSREHGGWNLGERILALSSWTRAHYIAGLLDSGIQPCGTPITAEPGYGNVTWRNEQGRILSASFSRTSQCWHLSNSVAQEPTQAGREMQRGDVQH